MTKPQDGQGPFDTDAPGADDGSRVLRFGWEEWVALPDLGLPALKVKVDTGARTSSLHAFDIETFGPATAPKVRFAVHPIPGRDDLVIPCSADVVDRRTVTSSNGESEDRYVIASTLVVGGEAWPIELTLTNRLGMTSHMLLGREALRDHISIVATDRFCQPELSYDVYHSTSMRKDAPKRALRIAVTLDPPSPESVDVLERSLRRHLLALDDGPGSVRWRRLDALLDEHAAHLAR